MRIIKKATDAVLEGKGRAFALAVISAILLPLAIPNELFKFGNPLIGLICLVPLYLAVTDPKRGKHFWLAGSIFGVVSTLIMYYWLRFFGAYSVYTIGGVTLAYAIYNAILFPALGGMLFIVPRYRPFVFACIWTFYELLKSSGFLAFPWGLLAHPFHSVQPLIQFVDVTGVWGLSFLIALGNALIGEWIRKDVREMAPVALPAIGRINGFNRLVRQSLVAGIFVCLAFAYGAFKLLEPQPRGNSLNAVLIQPNRDPWARNNYEQSMLDAIDLSEKGFNDFGGAADIIVWNETSFQHPFPESEAFLNKFPPKRPFLPFVRSLNTYFLVGAPFIVDHEDFSAMNSTVLLSPDGATIGHYGKIMPVPFVESNPLWSIPVLRTFFRKVVGIHGVWTTGNELTVYELPLKNGRTIFFSTPICFEDAFPDLCRRFVLKGADVLINLTNVSWSKTESAEIQMFVAAKFRAIETRRPLVRSTNSGVTSVVDQNGNVLARLPMFALGYLAESVPIPTVKTLTPYTVCGDYFPFLCGLVVLFVLVWNMRVCGSWRRER